MACRTFEWREDTEFGDWGWIPKGFPHFNAGQPMTIAHDVLEHQDRDDGSLAHELRAFGAMIHVRGEGGWFARRESLHDDWISNADFDLAEHMRKYRHHEGQEARMWQPPPTRALADQDIEDQIRRALERAVDLANREFGDNEPYELGPTTDMMRGWMRIGYRNALRRYAGHSPYTLADAFRELMARVGKHMQGDIGEELHVRVCNRTLNMQVIRKSSEDLMYA